MSDNGADGLSSEAVTQLNQAVTFHQQGRLVEAEALYRAILIGQPRHFDALQLLGAAVNQRGDHAQAVRLILEALSIQPNHAVAHYNCGAALLAMNRLDEALAQFDQAIALRPTHVGAMNNRATTLMMLGRPAQALEELDRALASQQDNAAVLANRAAVLFELKRFSEALADADRALALHPDNPFTLYNRANVLKDLNRLDEALADYDRALRIKPDYVEALINRGILLVDLRRLDEALDSYGRALALDPNRASARLNAGLCRLLGGDFPRGWDLYEARWHNEPLVHQKRDFAAPRWFGGGDLSGKTLFVYAEQGIGDTIQFCRLVAQACPPSGRIVLEVQPALKPLLEVFDGVTEVIAQGDPLPEFDAHCPLLSLAPALGITVDTIPARVPYISPPPAKNDAWAAKLGALGRPRVGLAWSGSPALKNDRNRSISLEKFAPLLRVCKTLVSLQKDIRPDEASWLAAHPEVPHFGSELQDFSDTAALIGQVDLVISVDTAVAHLAGAMGKPVWILLPYVGCDWRWMLNRADSSWYPTARLFRQARPGDWESVISQLISALAARTEDCPQCPDNEGLV